jgi:magnesium-transporting ATPase (P-type)
MIPNTATGMSEKTLTEKTSNGSGKGKIEKAGPTPEGAQANRALDFNTHTATSTKVLEALSVDAEAGLTESDASKRIDEYGPNRLKPPRRPSPFSIFLRQIGNAMTLVLSKSSLATRGGVS